MNRAYSLLTVKTVSEETRTITGTATTPSVDRVGDIIEPLGVKFKNPLPLLLFHDHDKPVGTVKFSRPTADGIEFEAKLPSIDEPGTLRDRVQEAWQSVRAGLIRAVSVGFRPLEPREKTIERIDNGGLRFLKTEVLELSLVVVPANQDATITAIKSLDEPALISSRINESHDRAKLYEELRHAERVALDRKLKDVVRLTPPALRESPTNPEGADNG